VSFLPLIALMCWKVTLGVVSTVVIRGVLPHFDLLVTGESLMPVLIEPVPRLHPEPAQKLSVLLSATPVAFIGANLGHDGN
jgi:hypothetical protein